MHEGYGKGSFLFEKELRDILKCVKEEFIVFRRDNDGIAFKSVEN